MIKFKLSKLLYCICFYHDMMSYWLNFDNFNLDEKIRK